MEVPPAHERGPWMPCAWFSGFIDLNLGGGQADRSREPDGLWQQWLQDAPHMNGDSDPTPFFLSLVRRLCAFVDECAEVL